MFIETLLNGTWDLRDEILSLELSHAPRLSHLADGWMPMPVPGDIHQGLIATGRIKEPLLGLNSFDCHWTEFRSWWLRKTFDAPSDWLDMDVIELELNGLDSNAELFLNGVHVGSHRSAFYPFVRDVKPWLVAGQNVLLVRLTAGVEDVADVEVEAPDGVRPPGEADRGRMERGDARRLVVRKPQYSFGWDWSPRLATTAIAGDVKLRAMRHACIRHVNLVPHQEPDGGVTVAATVTVDQFHYYKSSEGVVSLALTDAQGRRHEASARAVLRSGYTFVELKIPLPDPQLWWPNGMGAQHLYRVEAELAVGEQQMAFAPFDWGLRFLDLDTDGLFAVVVNGKHVFCKGGDWIPADALYARTDDARYETLVREARDANFTMLRIWGGGWYERDAFYQACDRHGILIWHDFMFACAPYPDHLESFRALVEREADYQTKRLQRHACIALWCGSNENNWGFRDWWSDRTQRGAHLYNYLLPSVVQRNCPEVPYWNGSPYGGDAPNSSEVGDQHYWHEAMMSPKMERRITPEVYDECTSLFISEFGYVGASVKDTVLTYMDGAPLERRGRVWQHHTNTFEQDTVEAGIHKHYIDPEKLSFDTYLLYSGLTQGYMYAYALEAMRYRPNCYGSIFWMYNDCWGEIGWTILDYYLRRKISYYFVRRAFAPVRLILRGEGDQVCVVVANDTQETLQATLEYGYVSLDGAPGDLKTVEVDAPPLARTTLASFERGAHDATRGLWMARFVDRPDISAGIFRAADFRQLHIVDPQLAVRVLSANGSSATVEISATGYAHGVHLTLPDGATPSDNYFDLLPGETREITISAAQPFAAEVIRASSVMGN